MKTIDTVIITLMLVIAVSYAVITGHELIEQDPDDIGEEILFFIAIVLYLAIVYWMIKTASLIPIVINIVGNAGLVILYIIAESELSKSLLGIDTEELSDFGITIKIFQIALIILSIMQIKMHDNSNIIQD